MSFDPTKPVNNSRIRASELREQFNGIIEIIDGTLVGLPGAPGAPGAKGDKGDQGERGGTGDPGEQGPPGPNFLLRGDWDGGTAYAAGEVVAYSGGVYVAFEDTTGATPDQGGPWRPANIPGPQGTQGDQGGQGDKGDTGDKGDQGEKGDKGDQGDPGGPQGDKGDKGDTGEPGEVSTDQMNTAISNAISGTANNPTELQPLDLTIDDPPTKAQVEAVRDRLNDLINALKRM